MQSNRALLPIVRSALRNPTLLLWLVAAPLLALAQTSAAQNQAALPQALIDKVVKLVDADSARLTTIFKDLHANPELGFTEKRTAGIVAKELKALGFVVTEGIGKTGVVGVFANGPGPTVWFRADMDANAVKEETGLPYASKVRQRQLGSEIDVMHACGHDAHVTWMLGLAKAMVTMKSDWSGTLVVYGQPAEELGLGAQAMVADGLWKRGFPKPDFAFSAHTAPGPVGYLSSSTGVRMAGTDQLDVTFYGVGGHGSQPQLTIDPVVMAAQAVLAYQTIVSRNMDPQAAAVVTVGAVVAGRDNNVIPQTAEVKLNTRWFTTAVREQLIRRIDEISKGVAVAAGVPADKMPTRVMKGGAMPLVNDAALIARINPSLEALMGKGKVVDNFPAVMNSEDFQEAFNELKTPLSFMLVGVAPPDMYAKALALGRSQPYSNHNPDFFVDLAAIPIGVKANVVAVLVVLARR
jgi:amidohydrolase